jgi:hypothetical protein
VSAEPRCLLLFPSIHHVLAAERALKAAGVPVDLVPVPKEISPDCGMAVTVAPADRTRALAALRGTIAPKVVDDWEP